MWDKGDGTAVSQNGRVLALTGGTGFIGSTLARGLVASGWQVRTLVRSSAKADTLRRLGAEPVLGDLCDPGALGAFIGGAKAVVHCAGAVRGTTEQEFNRVNASGLENLAKAANRLETPPLWRLLISTTTLRM